MSGAETCEECRDFYRGLPTAKHDLELGCAPSCPCGHSHASAKPMSGVWRVGSHYDIHVYEGDVPVATFHAAADASRAVDAVNGTAERSLELVREELAAAHEQLVVALSENARLRAALARVVDDEVSS